MLLDRRNDDSRLVGHGDARVRSGIPGEQCERDKTEYRPKNGRVQLIQHGNLQNIVAIAGSKYWGQARLEIHHSVKVPRHPILQQPSLYSVLSYSRLVRSRLAR